MFKINKIDPDKLEEFRKEWNKIISQPSKKENKIVKLKRK